MTFPTGTIATTGLAAGTDKPSDARAQLLAAVNMLNQIVTDKNTANNTCVLDGNGQVPSTSIPNTVSTSGTLVLSPGTYKVVNILNYLRLQVVPKATLLARSDNAVGDISFYADDLTGVNAGLAIYDGSHWKVIASLSSLSNLS
jgi:hypothetical protein